MTFSASSLGTATFLVGRNSHSVIDSGSHVRRATRMDGAVQKFLLAAVLAIVAMSAEGQLVSAQNLGPGEPDVVMECLYNGKPSNTCQFSCGSSLDQAPGGKKADWGSVRRVEFFYKGNVGRIDTRTWVFVAFKPGPLTDPPDVVALYIGPPVFCLAGPVTYGGDGGKIELRITKFKFN